MKGTERQLKWAQDILKPAHDIIEKIPNTAMKTRHLNSLNNIEYAHTVINARFNITDWTKRMERYIDQQKYHDEDPPQGYQFVLLPGVIRSIII